MSPTPVLSHLQLMLDVGADVSQEKHHVGIDVVGVQETELREVSVAPLEKLEAFGVGHDVCTPFLISSHTWQ